MKPKLILLTGPAAEDVAVEFIIGTMGEVKGAVREDRWWDEVRDYWKVPWELCFGSPIAGLHRECKGDWKAERDCLESRIRSLPGGEEWLVGLVLPSLPETLGYHPWPGLACDNFPARLAILAPEPPPLLVKRVNDWGGTEFYCYNCRKELSPDDNNDCAIKVGGKDGWGCYYPTWKESVMVACDE